MTDQTVSRRAFLKTATVASLGIAVAACQPITPHGRR
ncbi:MAG: twin-arginine translocation signal domain-containing protein [Caldilineaceae bacterium SB0670_bin_27]|uniref:Twin-arginine translocation signal domain-containing protein n=1 Tax=Caldilineaceae bacterium SB0664_bin_27 TaxID=2605260 RepID=A0A6B0YPN2_9CHLR|nr:twin-arginine translocation signal domain-containing protein [Caldilineaceae bacterium SB0664_bin_27]MYJ79507.1 twin-arginine translocation signal domain-containing protein [Caldilineaceae bacterium SB0670_bin_27]